MSTVLQTESGLIRESRKHFRVAIIQPIEEDRQLVKRFLKQSLNAYLTFVESGTGNDGLSLCGKKALDFLIVDLTLPDMSCLDLLAQLRLEDGLLPFPVLVLTGSEISSEGTSLTVRSGAQDFLRKQWLSPELLARSFESSVERYSLARRLADKQRHLDEALARAEEGSAAKSAFIAHVSHELRTPIAVIINIVRQLLRRERAPFLQEEFETVLRHSSYLLDVVNDLLDLSKVEQGKLAIQPKRFSLHSFVEELDRLMQSRRVKLSVPLSISYEGELPPDMGTDPVRMRQILINLMTNSLKFTPSGSVSTTLRVVASSANSYRLEASVKDTGIGMTPEELQKIFVPFHQGESSKPLNQGGAGLGLAITQRLVEALNGEMAVSSEKGRGSVFTVSIPLVTTGGRVARNGWLRRDRSILNFSLSGRLQGRRVLIVEDNDELARHYCDILREAHADPLVIGTAESALDYIYDSSNSNLDVLLVDVQLPGMSGHEFLARFREVDSLTPVIMMSASPSKELEVTCYSLNISGFLYKPFTEFGLVRAIERALNDQGKRRSGPINEALFVLLVEDDVDLARCQRQDLEELGFEVHEARSGGEAIQLLAERRPDIVLLDLSLPDGEGATIIKEFCQDQVPVIALTGDARPSTRERALLAGCSDFLLKPVSLRTLQQAIEKVLYEQEVDTAPTAQI